MSSGDIAGQMMKMQKLGLSADQLRNIARAIATAEQKTAAEIRVVVSGTPVIRHRFFPLVWAGAAALLLPWIIQFWRPMSGLAILEIQAAIFMVSALILMLPGLSDRVVPGYVLRLRVRAAAIETFLAHGMTQTTGRSGVLIFVAGHEHMVEVVADEGIHEHPGAETWAEICALITSRAREGKLGEGIIAGVERAGERLAEFLPPVASGVNELDDRVILL